VGVLGDAWAFAEGLVGLRKANWSIVQGTGPSAASAALAKFPASGLPMSGFPTEEGPEPSERGALIEGVGDSATEGSSDEKSRRNCSRAFLSSMSSSAGGAFSSGPSMERSTAERGSGAPGTDVFETAQSHRPFCIPQVGQNIGVPGCSS
jgi:hypothetical protein